MIQIRFQSDCNLKELENLRNKIYAHDIEPHISWFEDLITYNVRVEISNKTPQHEIEEIKSLCKNAAIYNYIEVYSLPNFLKSNTRFYFGRSKKINQ